MLSTRNYIINIAIDNYPNLETLNGNQEVLTQISNLLIEKYEFDYNNLINLFNEKATQKGFYDVFNSLKSRELENLIVFYSGHGTAINGTNGYFQMYDAVSENTNTWLAHSEFLDYIKQLNAKNIFVAVKACNSGYLFKKIQNTNAITDDIGEGKSRFLFTSSSGNDLTNEISPFWDFIYESLKGNGSKRTSINSIVSQVKIRMDDEYDNKLIPREGKMDDDEGGMMYLILKENEETIWEKTKKIDTIEEYSTYLKLFSTYKNEATKRLSELRKEKELWENFLKESIEKLENLRDFSVKNKNFLEEKINSFSEFYEELMQTDRFEIDLNNLNTGEVAKLLSDHFFALDIELNKLDSIIEKIDFFTQKYNNSKVETLKSNLEKIKAIRQEKYLWQEVQNKKKNGSKSYANLRNAYAYYIMKTTIRAYENEAQNHIRAFDFLIYIEKLTTDFQKIEKYNSFFLKFNPENFAYYEKVSKDFQTLKTKMLEKEKVESKNNQILQDFEKLANDEDLDAISKLLSEVEDEVLKQRIQNFIDDTFINLDTKFQEAKIINTLESLNSFIQEYKEKVYAKSIVQKAILTLEKKAENEFKNISKKEEYKNFIDKWVNYNEKFVKKSYEELENLTIIEGNLQRQEKKDLIVSTVLESENLGVNAIIEEDFIALVNGAEIEKTGSVNNISTEYLEKDIRIVELEAEVAFLKRNIWDKIEDGIENSYFRTVLFVIAFVFFVFFIISILKK